MEGHRVSHPRNPIGIATVVRKNSPSSRVISSLGDDLVNLQNEVPGLSRDVLAATVKYTYIRGQSSYCSYYTLHVIPVVQGRTPCP